MCQIGQLETSHSSFIARMAIKLECEVDEVYTENILGIPDAHG